MHCLVFQNSTPKTGFAFAGFAGTSGATTGSDPGRRREHPDVVSRIR